MTEKKYEEPKMNVVALSSDDVVCTSDTGDNESGFKTLLDDE